MSIFEQIPGWAQQQQMPQQQPFNAAPQIMSQYQHGQMAPMQMPQMPPPPQDPSGATSASPMGAMGGVASMLGNPQSSQGPGGMMALLAAIQKANAPKSNYQMAPTNGMSQLAQDNQMPGVPSQQFQSMMDSQMPGSAPGGSGGLMSWLSNLFGGSGGSS